MKIIDGIIFDPNKVKTRMEVNQVPTVSHTNKKKYNRKPKHKNKLEE